MGLDLHAVWADVVLDLHAVWACRVVGARTQREIKVVRCLLLLFIPSVLCGALVWASAPGRSRSLEVA